jgi:ABC-type transport system involved in multi-copper enzyme maturation permease subunit
MAPDSPDRPSLIGILLSRELFRAFRSGRVFQLAVLFLYLMLLASVLFAVWWSMRGDPLGRFTETSPTSPAAFARSFSLVLIETQLLFVVLVAPAFAATAIAGEKDKRTLALLQTTQLSDDDIVWGKALAAAVVVMLVVLAGVPLWVVASTFIALPLPVVVRGYVLSIGTAVLAAALGARAGCVCTDGRSALLRAYVYAAVFVAGIPILVPFSPFAVLAYGSGAAGPWGLRLADDAGRWGLALGYAAGQVAAGTIVLLRSPRHLRGPKASAGEPDATAYPEPPRGRAEPPAFTLEGARAYPFPPLDAANPVRWRERHAARSRPFPILDKPVRWVGVVGAGFAAFLFSVGVWQLMARVVLGLDPDSSQSLPSSAGTESPGSGWLAAAGVVFAGLFLVPSAVGVSGCIAGERQRGTLDSLLLTLLPRRAILWAKVRAHLEHWLVFAVASLTATGCGFSAAAGFDCGLAVTAAVAAGFWFATASAAWFSVRAKSPGQALSWCLAPATGVGVMPLVFWTLVSGADTVAATAGAMWTAGVLTALGAVAWWRAVAGLGEARS